MTLLRAAAIVLLTSAAGCGGCGSDDNNTPDAFIIHDMAIDARVCGTATDAGNLDFVESDDQAKYIIWGGDLTGTNFGTGGVKLEYQFEIYGGLLPTLAGTFDLHVGDEANYSTCSICIRAFVVDAQNKVVKQYFQSAGTVTFTEDPYTTKHLVGSISGLELEEVTITSGTFVSTPVAGGECGSFANFSVDHDRVPNAWTCPHADYDSTTNCNCVCGLPDPDCAIDAPVMGCTVTEPACFNDVCVTPPTNDTCASATPIMLATPVTGSTAGAKHNYSLGLQGAACTGYAQPGPDTVYSISLMATQQITVTLSGAAATYDGAIALVGPGDATICDASPITTCVAGADDTADGQDETFTYTAPADGDYFIIVDGYAPNEGGTYTLTVTSP